MITTYRPSLMTARKKLVDDYKLQRGCEHCGYREDPRALDLDHRDPAQKLGKVSQIARRYSLEKLMTELEKCRVLCANCHRIKTCEAQEYLGSKERGRSAAHSSSSDTPL